MLQAQSSSPVIRLHVSQVAERTGVTAETIRYYTRIGLLHPGRDEHNGYRYFSTEDIELVEFVRKAQALGLSIKQIREVLGMVEAGRSPCGRVEELVSSRLEEIAEQIVNLENMKRRLESALETWREAPDVLPESAHFCALIEGCSR